MKENLHHALHALREHLKYGRLVRAILCIEHNERVIDRARTDLADAIVARDRMMEELRIMQIGEGQIPSSLLIAEVRALVPVKPPQRSVR